MTSRFATRATMITGASILAAAMFFVGIASASSKGSPLAIPNGTVYQANLVCCQQIILPAWPAEHAPILTTKVIPPGTYSVTGNAFIVIGPSDVADNCFLTTSNSSDIVSGVGGATGNGASESGTGGGGVYANAVSSYTVVITAAKDHITLNCETKHFGQGTYAASATLIAIKVPGVVGV
jgi:hypothetical protein